MQKSELKVKTTAMVGPPEEPVAESVVAALTQLVAKIAAVHEAHLTQVHMPGLIDPPALTLVVVLDPDADENDVLREIDEALHKVIPPELELGVWPLASDDESLDAIRSIGCQLNAVD